MNVGPGGKQAHLRDTTIPEDNPYGRRCQPQQMVFPSTLPRNHPGFGKWEGQPKGMKVVLAERGYDVSQVIGDCKECKARRARKPQIEGLSPSEATLIEEEEDWDTDDEDDKPKNCCMRRILSLQVDFAEEQSLLKTVSTSDC